MHDKKDAHNWVHRSPQTVSMMVLDPSRRQYGLW